MAMHETDKLTMMANQIAQFFRSYPHDEAVAGIASHIEAFWTPRMVGVLRAQAPGIGHLDPLVLEAFTPAIEAMSPGREGHHGSRQDGRTRRGRRGLAGPALPDTGRGPHEPIG